jgi:hypothetical protein
MEGLPIAAILSQAVSRRQLTSALPDAPVVEEPQRPPRIRAERTRSTLARFLQRAAVAVAPSSTARTASASGSVEAPPAC